MTVEEVDSYEELEKKLIEKPTAQVLSIVTGGMDGTGNWMSHIEEGTVFHSRIRAENSPDCEQWHLKFKFNKTAILYSNFPQNREFYRLVDMLAFSKQNEFLEIVQEKKQEIEND